MVQFWNQIIPRGQVQFGRDVFTSEGQGRWKYGVRKEITGTVRYPLPIWSPKRLLVLGDFTGSCISGPSDVT